MSEINITGNVTFGGCAAKFNANTGTFTEHATIHKLKLFSAKNEIESNVIGNIIPMCPKRLMATMKNISKQRKDGVSNSKKEKIYKQNH